MEEIEESPEVLWLNSQTKKIDCKAIAGEELSKSKQIFEAFFTPEPSRKPVSSKTTYAPA